LRPHAGSGGCLHHIGTERNVEPSNASFPE
jgi:hypothetical protein